MAPRIMKRMTARLLAFGLAAVFVVFVAQAVAHSHEVGQNDATCQVCQAAHLGPVLQAASLLPHAPLKATGYVEPFVAAFHEELFFHDCPSRAPPTA